jgi:Zn-dependent protease with chaperone function
VRDPELTSRFVRLAEAARIALPRFEQIDLRGGVVANALVIATTGRATVLITDTIGTRFSADEVEAICAHELAHLEHANPGYVRRTRLAELLLIVVAVTLSPMLRMVAPGWISFVKMIWIGAAAVGLAVSVARRQKHETASDVRAVTLSGNPDALVSALVKTHAIARLPRRSAQGVEQMASHPSLEHRILAIRAAPATLARQD